MNNLPLNTSIYRQDFLHHIDKRSIYDNHSLYQAFQLPRWLIPKKKLLIKQFNSKEFPFPFLVHRIALVIGNNTSQDNLISDSKEAFNNAFSSS